MIDFVNQNAQTIDNFIRDHEYDIWSVEEPIKNVSSLSVGKWVAIRGEKEIEILHNQNLFGRFDEDSKKLEILNEDQEISFGEWSDFQRLREYLYNFQLN